VLVLASIIIPAPGIGNYVDFTAEDLKPDFDDKDQTFWYNHKWIG